jgi:hypothetical protein
MTGYETSYRRGLGTFFFVTSAAFSASTRWPSRRRGGKVWIRPQPNGHRQAVGSVNARHPRVAQRELTRMCATSCSER